jgi:hypothetical protein
MGMSRDVSGRLEEQHVSGREIGPTRYCTYLEVQTWWLQAGGTRTGRQGRATEASGGGAAWEGRGGKGDEMTWVGWRWTAQGGRV